MSIADSPAPVPVPAIVNIRREIALKLTVLARQLRTRFDQSVENANVTRSQWSLIAVVARRPGTSQRAIAEMLDMSEAAAGRAVDRLCADGLLERRAKEDDKRAHCVFLTDAAGPLLDRLGQLAVRHEQMSFAGLTDADLERLNEMLEIIHRNIGQ